MAQPFAALHPRAPGGAPGGIGGQFVPKKMLPGWIQSPGVGPGKWTHPQYGRITKTGQGQYRYSHLSTKGQTAPAGGRGTAPTFAAAKQALHQHHFTQPAAQIVVPNPAAVPQIPGWGQSGGSKTNPIWTHPQYGIIQKVGKGNFAFNHPTGHQGTATSFADAKKQLHAYHFGGQNPALNPSAGAVPAAPTPATPAVGSLITPPAASAVKPPKPIPGWKVDPNNSDHWDHPVYGSIDRRWTGNYYVNFSDGTTGHSTSFNGAKAQLRAHYEKNVLGYTPPTDPRNKIGTADYKKLRAIMSGGSVSSGNRSVGGDAALGEIYHLQGYHAQPQVVDKAGLDAAVSAGWTELHRGIKDFYVNYNNPKPTKTGKQLAEEFRTGPTHYPGYGIYGNGTYMSTDPNTARSYAGLNYGNSGTGGLLRIAIDPKARITSLAKIQAEMKKARYGMGADAGAVTADVGRYAALAGWDGYWTKIGSGANAEKYYVMLNRGIMKVQKA